MEPHLLWSTLVWSPKLCLGYDLGCDRGHWCGICCLSRETTCCEGLFCLQSWIRYGRSFLRTGIDSILLGTSHCLWRVQALPKKKHGCQKGHLCISWKASAAKGTDSKLLGKESQKNPLQSSSQTVTSLPQPCLGGWWRCCPCHAPGFCCCGNPEVYFRTELYKFIIYIALLSLFPSTHLSYFPLSPFPWTACPHH